MPEKFACFKCARYHEFSCSGGGINGFCSKYRRRLNWDEDDTDTALEGAINATLAKEAAAAAVAEREACISIIEEYFPSECGEGKKPESAEWLDGFCKAVNEAKKLLVERIAVRKFSKGR